ncbi:MULTISPECIES: hypothetical protein [Neisseria]|uniref:hypothetical protein n=1 Tax=Neisseria TaxID=482 RepID=UPI000F714856|nr:MULTISPECIES: hypothetical protein [Neisseria]MDO1510253.1 hypothetical protein [Neisseria sp. MVDL19-042950]MDO1516422.1 hypothetical protein [Neisseria sp. MVDL18-041461]MDO1563570.1 hypothetical protein [Neisseria sp. MVDL20-010259]VEH88291.1 Uncharacterised protein [Neisseria animaloris]
MKKGYYLKLSIAFLVLSVVNFLLSPKQDGIPFISIFFIIAAVVAFFIHRKKG